MLRRLNLLIRLTLFWIFNAVYGVFILTFSILTLRRFLDQTIQPFCRFWSSVCLWLMDTKIEVSGLNHLLNSDDGPFVFLFNHASTLDIFVCTHCMPKRSMAIAKREIMYVPFINIAWWAFGFSFLKRGRGLKSREVFNRYTEKVFAKGRVLLAAPEGTRTKDGSILPFKMGSFYAAMNAKVPVQFLVIYNAYDIWPVSRWFPRPGNTVRAEFMKPIDTSDWTDENIVSRVEALRKEVAERIDAYREKNVEAKCLKEPSAPLPIYPHTPLTKIDLQRSF